MSRFHLAMAGVFLLPIIAYAAPVIEREPHLFEPSQNDEKAQDVPTTISNQIYCSCVQTARFLGAKLPYGNASELVPNATPSVGGVVILHYPSAYHVAYITALSSDGIHIAEGNYKHCEYTERVIPYDYKPIVGFWFAG